MLKKKFKDINVSFFDDCNTIIIERLNAFKLYMQLDMGLTPDKFMDHSQKIGRAINYLNKLDKSYNKDLITNIYQELSNLHIAINLSSNGVNFRYQALATLVDEIDGEKFTNYHDLDELNEIVSKLSKVMTDGEVTEIIDHSKKKFLTNLN